MAASSNVFDLCRLCGTSTLNIVRHAIFEGEGRTKKYALKISECLPLQVTEEDPLPKNMCGECSYKLDLLSDFREKAVKTNDMLVSLVDGVKPELPDEDDGPDNEVDNDDFRSSSPEQPEPEVLIKEEEQQHQPEKRPGRKAANKRPIRESDDEEEEEAPVKKRGRKPKETTTPAAAAAAPPKENTGPPPLVVRTSDAGRQPLIGPPLFQCRHCRDLFETNAAVRRHIWDEHRFKCSSCDFVGDDQVQLDKHVEQHHNDKENLPRCCVCMRACIDRDAYRAHLRLHIGALPYECESCDRLYTDIKRLERHVKRHLPPKKALPKALPKRTVRVPVKKKAAHSRNSEHYCIDCKIEFKTREAYRRHRREVHKYQCPCGLFFTSDHQLQRHRSTVHPSWIHPCRQCKSSFNTPLHLARHVDSKHPRKTYPCKECGEVMKSMVGIITHRMNDRCKMVKLKADLSKVRAKNHMEKIKAKLNLAKEKADKIKAMNAQKSKRVFCDFCRRAFQDKEVLEKHMELTHVGSPTTCKLCQHNCPSSAQMAQHMRYHEEKKKPECLTCHYLANSNEKLEEHMIRHADVDAPFFCSVCKLNFRAKVWADKHVEAYHAKTGIVMIRPNRGHLEVSRRPPSKPESSSPNPAGAAVGKKCLLCLLTFKDMICLNKHIMEEHEDRKNEPHPCAYCKLKFEDLATYKTHVKAHHNIRVHMPLRCPDCDHILQSSYNLSRHCHQVHPKCPYCHEKQISRATLVSHVSTKHPGMPEPKLDFRRSKEHSQPKIKSEANTHRNKSSKVARKTTTFVVPKVEIKQEPDTFESLPIYPPFLPPVDATYEPHNSSALRLVQDLTAEPMPTPGPSGVVPAGSPTQKTNKNVTCTMCQFTCANMGQIKFHQVNAHFYCAECSYQFDSQLALQEHIRTHPNRQCPLCGSKLNTGSSMQMHVTRKHQADPLCAVCLALLETNAELALHYAKEHPQMIKCNICDCYMKRGSLKSHINAKHSEGNRFGCNHCEKSFVNKCTLDQHMRIHTGDKPYQCPCCSECFFNGPLMVKHAKVHSLNDEGGYVHCPWCKKIALSITDLGKHVAQNEACSLQRDNCIQQPPANGQNGGD